MSPDIDHLILCLTTYRHSHNIQTSGHYFSLATSIRPTNVLFTPAKCLLQGYPFSQLTTHVIDLNSDMGWLIQVERDSGVGAKSVTFGREDPWLASQSVTNTHLTLQTSDQV